MFRYNLQVVFAQIITWMTFAGVRYWKLTHGLEHQGKMGCGETGLSEVMPQAMFLFVQPGIDISLVLILPFPWYFQRFHHLDEH